MFKFNKASLFTLIAAVTLLGNPMLVLAQPATSTATLSNANLPTYSGVDDSLTQYLCTPSQPADGKDLERCINRLYRFGVVSGALVLVFMVVLAGYFYITGGETGIGKAKGIIMNSVVGMALLLGSYALLYFINPSLVAFKPIQPPIFDAERIPTCAELGLSKDADCAVVESGAQEGGSAPASSGWPGPSGTAQQLAQQILGRDDIKILCLSSATTCASSNIKDTAAGKAAGRSCASQGISGTAALSPQLLSGILGLAEAMDFTININHINGGCHSKASSYHYQGRAVDMQVSDISQVNRIHEWCASKSAVEHFGPTHNPHPRHAHCVW